MTMEPLNEKNITKSLRSSLTVQDYTPAQKIEGVKIVEAPHFFDDGGYFVELSRFVGAQPKEFEGFEVKQMNVSEMMPGVIKAAHLHFKQEDIWFVPPSHRMLIGLKDVREGSPTEGVSMRFVLGGGKARMVYIPRGVAHGAGNLWNQPAMIVYLVNNEFSPDASQTDEHRLPWTIFGEGFWELSKE